MGTKGLLPRVLDSDCTTSPCCMTGQLSAGLLSLMDVAGLQAHILALTLRAPIPGLTSNAPCILPYQPLISNSAGPGLWRRKLVELPASATCCAKANPLRVTLLQILLRNQISQPRLLSSKPFYLRGAISLYWVLTWDLQDNHNMSP